MLTLNTIAPPAPNNYMRLLSQRLLLPLHKYKIRVMYSGGKDSLALTLMLLDMGIKPEDLELWHQHVDGEPGTRGLFDWPCTEAYVRATGEALGIPVRFAWKDGGFEGEMLREDALTRGIYFEDHDGTVRYSAPNPPAKWCKECRQYFPNDKAAYCTNCGTLRKGFNTRLMFPMKTADLSRRWCSSYVKIQVAQRQVCQDPYYAHGNVLFVTGERRQESSARAEYDEVVEHVASNQKRRVDQWRSIIDWKEEHVWEIIERWRIRAHPAYYLGWGRVSCMACIFGDKDQWASVRELDPYRVSRIAAYETMFGKTIHQGKGVNELADSGTSFVSTAPKDLVALALGTRYPVEKFFLNDGEDWEIPAGAYKRCGGPT